MSYVKEEVLDQTDPLWYRRQYQSEPLSSLHLLLVDAVSSKSL